jgi:hypothetical protein
MMAVTATIVELDDQLRAVGAPTPVDFNPQSLRLTHSSTGTGGTQGTSGAKAEATTRGRQVTNFTTSLSMDLLFDTSRDGSDVRAKTLPLVALTRPKNKGSSVGGQLQFQWGTFLFKGYIESLGETIDLFSADGVPLRATLAVSMRGVAERDTRPTAAVGAGFGAGAGAGIGLSAGASFGAGVSAGASFGAGVSAGASLGAGVSAGASFGAGVSAGASFGTSASASASAGVGTKPLTLSASGDTVQSLAAKAGVSWKAVAAANGIDNPRLLPPGTVLDLKVTT